MLACGPVLGWMLRASAMGLQLLDGFVFASILGLCFVHLIPEAVAGAGVLAVGTLALGFLAPLWIERKMGELPGRDSHGWILFLVMVGLVAHSALDGAALAGAAAHGPGGRVLPLAVAGGIVLHRLPVGLLIWWAFRPRFGTARALLVLAMVGTSTIWGYLLLGDALHELGGVLTAHVVAFVAGSILHVVLHQTRPEGFSHRTHNCPHWAGAGAMVAMGLLWFLGAQPEAAHGHAHAAVHPGSVAEAFRHLVIESAPALLLGFLAAGLVQTFLPEAGVAWLRRGGAVRQTLKGMAFGLPLPICSCGVVPVYQSLVRRGAPLTAGLAFLVATPELGIDALLLTIPLLGAPMAAARLAAAVAVAMVVGLVVGTYARGTATEGEGGCGSECCKEEAPPGLGAKLAAAWRYGMIELVDHTGPWIFTGLLVAAVAEPYLQLDGLVALPAWQQVLVLTLIGMPIYVCATGATPVAAVLLAKGVAPGAVIAFLLAGPATNVTTFGVLRQLHGRRVALAFVVVTVACCFLAGMAGGWFPELAGAAELAETHEHAPSALELGATAIMALAFLGSLLRQGPRGLVRQVIALEGHEDCGEEGPEAAHPDPHDGHHGHACPEATPVVAHDHGCDHDHGCGGEEMAGSPPPS